MRRLPLILALASLASVPFIPEMAGRLQAADRPSEWPLESGACCAFDGVFYSYAHPEGQGIKLWCPPGEGPVRGVILFGNPGGGLGGDTRDKSRQRDLMEFASRHGFGVAGVTGFPGRDTYEKLGRRVLEAFDAWGRHGRHPELCGVPFLFSGSSNAGIFAFAMMALVPERTICITPNVGPFYTGTIGETARKVPAWMHVGTTDPFFPAGIEDTEALFAEHGDRALWTWEAEIKGHQNGSSDHVDLAYWNALIPLRLPPAKAPGASGPVPLRELDRAAGWIADFRTWDHRMATVFPASQAKNLPQEKGRIGWLPDEGIARLYQSAATRARQMTISFVVGESVAGGASAGTYLSAGGSYVASPGDTVTVQVKLADLQQPLNPIEFYDRAEKIGEIDGTKTLEFSFEVDGRPIYAIHARAFQQGFESSRFERVSNPLQLVVRQPKLSAAIDAQLASVDWRKIHKTRALDPVALARLKGDPGTPAGTLRASPLDPQQTATLRPDGKLSEIWEVIGRAITPTSPGKESLVSGSGDIGIRMSAAYGQAGLYFLFRVDDTASGRLDFHVASTGLPQLLAARGSLEAFATPALNQLLRHALQISFPVAGSADVSVNRWDPWDCLNVQLSPADEYGATGLWIDRIREKEGTRTVELFLPWTMAGNPGFRSSPPAGTSLVVEIGYDSPAPVKLRWPHGEDPWASDPANSTGATPAFGQIYLLPPSP